MFRNVSFNVIQPQLNSTPLGKWKTIGHQGHLENVIIQHHDEVHNDIPVMEDIARAPRWQRQSLRGRKFSENDIAKILDHLEKDDFRVAGDVSVRDQLGSFAFCYASKKKDRPFMTCTGPVDGNRHHMRALRAEYTHALAALSLLQILEPYASSFCNTTLPKSIKHKIMKLARKKTFAHWMRWISKKWCWIFCLGCPGSR